MGKTDELIHRIVHGYDKKSEAYEDINICRNYTEVPYIAIDEKGNGENDRGSRMSDSRGKEQTIMNEQMRKFRALLDAEHIEWDDLSDNGIYPICRTHFEYNGQEWSVIHGYGSYGGYDVFTGADEGLLEAYNFVEEPKGFLTAEQVMQCVKGAEE